MDKNYTDEELKKILESPPEFIPEESAVLDMQQRLRAVQKQPRKRNFLPFLWSLLFLSLLLGSGYFYQKYNQLNEQVIALSQQINEISNTKTIDTIIEKKITYQMDTIYNVIYRYKYITENKPIQNQFSIMDSRWSNLNPWNSTGRKNTPLSFNWSQDTNRFLSFAKKPDSSIFENENRKPDSSLRVEKLENTFDELDIHAQDFLSIYYNRDLSSLSENQELLPSFEKIKVNPMYYFVPTGFKIGVNSNPLILPMHDFGGNGFVLGLRGAIELPKNRSLEIGAELVQLQFQLKDEVAQNSIFPIANPTDPTDFLHELKAQFKYLQIPVTLRQKFRMDKKLQPMFSFGWVAYKPIQQNFIYEYVNNTGEYKTKMNFKEGDFLMDNLRLGLGAEYLFGEKISTALELQYQHGFSKSSTEYFNLRYWGLNFGLNYKL